MLLKLMESCFNNGAHIWEMLLKLMESCFNNGEQAL